MNNRQSQGVVKTIKEEVLKPLSHQMVDAIQNQFLIIIIVLAGFCRGYYLRQPIKYDESWTFLNYVNQANPLRVFWYNAFNNHLLNTILIKISTVIFGDSLLSIRLVAFTTGLSIVLLVYLLSRKLGQIGIFGSLVTAVTPYLIGYSSNARGYSLLISISLFLSLIGITFLKQINLKREDIDQNKLFILAIIAALGLLTLPTMAFPIVGIYTWMGAYAYTQGYKIKKIIIGLFGKSGLLILGISALFYSPTLIFTRRIISYNERFAKGEDIDRITFLSRMPTEIINTFKTFTNQIPSQLIIVFLILVLIGFASNSGDFVSRRLLIPCIIGSSFCSYLLMKLELYPRIWIYLIPYFAIYADAGFSSIFEKLRNSTRKLLIVLIFAASIMTIRITIYQSPVYTLEEKSYPEAPIIMNYLKQKNINTDSQIENIIVPSHSETPMLFYQWYLRMPYTVNGYHLKRDNSIYSWVEGFKSDLYKFLRIKPQSKIISKDSLNANYYIINNIEQNMADLTKDKYQEVFKYGEMSLYKKANSQ